jgi:hypothetical protein
LSSIFSPLSLSSEIPSSSHHTPENHSSHSTTPTDLKPSDDAIREVSNVVNERKTRIFSEMNLFVENRFLTQTDEEGFLSLLNQSLPKFSDNFTHFLSDFISLVANDGRTLPPSSIPKLTRLPSDISSLFSSSLTTKCVAGQDVSPLSSIPPSAKGNSTQTLPSPTAEMNILMSSPPQSANSLPHTVSSPATSQPTTQLGLPLPITNLRSPCQSLSPLAESHPSKVITPNTHLKFDEIEKTVESLCELYENLRQTLQEDISNDS